MANSVTFPTEYGGSGITITDDADPTTGLDGTGYMTRFVPALKGSVDMAAWAKQKAVETNADRQQTGLDREAVAADRQAVATDRAKVEADLQDAEARIGSTQELIDARDASLDAQAGAIDARTGAEAARDQTNNLADATAQNTATYASTAGGLAATVDGDYFRVMTVPTANEITVYRNDAGSATLIATYYTKGGVDERNAQATRLARSLQRLGDRGQTLHSDFAYGAYGLGSLMSGGVDQALAGEELFSVVRASPKWVWQPSGPNGEMRLTEVAPNTIARHWNPVTGEPLGARIEDEATNLLTYSQAFDNAGWNKNRSSIAANSIVAPDGSLSAYKLIEDTQTGAHEVQVFYGPATEGAQYTASIYVKAAERTVTELTLAGSAVSNKGAQVDLASEVDGVNSKYVGNGWHRVWVTQTASGVGAGSDVSFIIRSELESGLGSYAGDGVSGIYIWGAQLEEGSQPSSYIPTEDAPVTRAADQVSRVTGGEFNTSEFTIVIDVRDMIADGVVSPVIFSIYDPVNGGDINNSLYVYGQPGGVSFVVRDGTGVIGGAFGRGSGAVSDGRVAISVSRTEMAWATVGASGTVPLTGAFPRLTTPTLRLFEHPAGALNQPVSACAADAQMYPFYMTAAELEELVS